MKKEEIEAVIGEALVCRLGMADEKGPYVVPLCFGYEDGVLYFHGSPSGRKVNALRRDPRVCFEIDMDVAIQRAETACATSVRYRSVIGFGRAFFIEDREEKVKALNALMRQYADGDHEVDDAQLGRTTVFGVRIESMTGRQAGY